MLPNAVIEDSGAAAEEPEEAAEEEESGETAPIKLPFRLGGQGTQRVKAQPPVAPVRPPAQGTARIKAAVQVGLSQMNPACIWTRLIAVLITACLVLL